MIRPPILRLLASATGGFLVGLSLVLLLGRLVPIVQARESSSPVTVASSPVFGSDAGPVLNFIKPDRTSDFESAVEIVRKALAKSGSKERMRQAASWKVFRSVEPAVDGSVVYLFTIDPSDGSSDYSVLDVLSDAFPREARKYYRQYAESYAAGQSLVNLTPVRGVNDRSLP